MLTSTPYHPNLVWLSTENFKRNYSFLSLKSTEPMIKNYLFLSSMLYYSNANKNDHNFQEAFNLMNFL